MLRLNNSRERFANRSTICPPHLLQRRIARKLHLNGRMTTLTVSITNTGLSLPSADRDLRNPRSALWRLVVYYSNSNSDLGLRNCRDVLGRSGLKESKQEMGMATEFQSRSRHWPVLRRRSPKLSLKPPEFVSCPENSTKINLAQLRLADSVRKVALSGLTGRHGAYSDRVIDGFRNAAVVAPLLHATRRCRTIRKCTCRGSRQFGEHIWALLRMARR
jgi:hypothetical protein